jgi:hypothetical protein
MSRNIIFVLVCHHHKLLDLLYSFHVVLTVTTTNDRPVFSSERAPTSTKPPLSDSKKKNRSKAPDGT